MGTSLNYDEIMDETAVAGYIGDAKTDGFFTSPDSDMFIIWETSAVKVQDPDEPYTP